MKRPSRIRNSDERGLQASLVGQVLVEECIFGWEELELEVVRDADNNKITVCFIENIDPIGVHTGDSFCSAPMLTIHEGEINAPIYATKLTIGLIENKLKEHNLLRTTKRKTIKHGQSINLGCFRIEFIKTNHSIQDASALAIYSPAGIVVHTGDFKVDYTPVFGDAIDLQRFAEIGKKGVLALMCDSTNAERKGFTMSERTVGKTFDNLFAEHKNTRIIIATFASNVDRVQQ